MSEIPQLPIIFSTVYVISIGIIIVLLVQMQKNLNVRQTEQEKILKVVEENLELSKLVKTEFQTLRIQLENLLELFKKLENNFNHFQGEYPLRLTENNQVLSDKFEMFSALPQQIDGLTKISTSLENRFEQILEADNTNHLNTTQTLSAKLDQLIPIQVENLAQSTQNLENRLTELLTADNSHQEKLSQIIQANQALSDKFDLTPVQNQVETVIANSTNLENRFTQLLTADDSHQEKLSQIIQANQALSDKFDLTPVQNQIETVIANSTNLENRFTQLLETQNQSVAKLTLLVEETNSQLDQIALTEKLKELDMIKSEVTKLVEINTDLEASLSQFMEQKKTRSSKKGFG